MTHRPRRVLCDVDGVLCNFTAGALAAIERVTGEAPPPDLLDEWDTFRYLTNSQKDAVWNLMEDPGWCYGLEVLPGAVLGIRQLRRAGVEVYFVTAPWHGRNWVYERDEWLRNYFDADRKHIVHTDAKFLVTGDVFVDDKYEHVVNWKEHHPNGLPILWNAPYNKSQSFERRGNSWELVLDCARG